jgi:hypothetical protein
MLYFEEESWALLLLQPLLQQRRYTAKDFEASSYASDLCL